MIGIVVFGHEEFCMEVHRQAVSFADSYGLSAIDIATITVDPGDSAESRSQELLSHIASFRGNKEILILAHGSNPGRHLFNPDLISGAYLRVLGSANFRMLSTALMMRKAASLNSIVAKILTNEAEIHLAPDLDTEANFRGRYVQLPEMKPTVASFLARPEPLEDRLAGSLGLASSLKDLVPNLTREIERLERRKPNNTDTQEAENSAKELLRRVRSGVEEYLDVAASIDVDNPDQKLSEADVVQHTIKREFEIWWEENSKDAVDWAIRFPVIGVAIVILTAAGTPPLLASGVAIATVGGGKLLRSVRDFISS